MSAKFDYHILFDGGSKNNGAANQSAYGSYLIYTRKGQQRLERLQFGNATSNEAEYQALNEALYDILQCIKSDGRTPSDFSIRIVGDSLLVLNQITGKWKCKAYNLIPIKTVAQHHLAQFAHWQVEHVDRSVCVHLLGH